MDNIFINHIFKRIFWNIIKFIKRHGEIINSSNFKISVGICFRYMIKFNNFTFNFFFLLLFLNIRTEYCGIKKIHWKVNTFEGLSPCVHTSIIKMFAIWCMWVITIIFQFNFCGRIVSKFIFYKGFINRYRIGGRIMRNIPFW